MTDRKTREEIVFDKEAEADCDGTFKMCEKEKKCIAKEVQKLRDEMAELRAEAMSGISWRDSLSVFDNAEKDLLGNLDQATQLKTMKGELQKELTDLAQQATQLKRLVLAKEESSFGGERKTRQLNDVYIEKQDVVQKIDSTIKANLGQRNLILGALRNVAKTLMSRLYEEKLRYYDLKFSMCSFLQEYHKLKKKYKDAEKTIRILTDQSKTIQTPSTTLEVLNTRSLNDILHDIDTLAQNKLSSIGIRSNLILGKDKGTHMVEGGQINPTLRVSGNLLTVGDFQVPPAGQSPPPLNPENGRTYHLNTTTPPKPRGEEKQGHKPWMSIFKDRSLDISRNSHISAKSNLSRRYEANDEGDTPEEGSEEEHISQPRSINKYPGSYLERSNNQFRSMASTPDKSLTKVRGISPIGQHRDGNSYFISPERYVNAHLVITSS